MVEDVVELKETDHIFDLPHFILSVRVYSLDFERHRLFLELSLSNVHGSHCLLFFFRELNVNG